MDALPPPLDLRALSALAAYQNKLSDELKKAEAVYESNPILAVCIATKISLQQRKVANKMKVVGNRYLAGLADFERRLSVSDPRDRSGDHTSGEVLMTQPEDVACSSPSPSAGSTASSSPSSQELVMPSTSSVESAQRYPSESSHNNMSEASFSRTGRGKKAVHRACEVPGCEKLARGVGPQSRRCAGHGGGHRCFCGKVARGSTKYCGTHGGGRRCQQEGCRSGAAGASNYCITHGGGKRCSMLDCTKAACSRSDRCFEHGGGRRCEREGCNRGAIGSTKFCIKHGGGKRCMLEGCDKGAVAGGYCVRHGGTSGKSSNQQRRPPPEVPLAMVLATDLARQEAKMENDE
ncbi:hypothetical protein FOL47_001249 [Perkinsus chesapeaki]|uniref:WRKY19-like zinc finger domain-containing protein n=1 Tax=Perkinsus chesapeaki TaxID=330153 RepID=A0A7J6ML80_PERCH|nr:hypothetical protein FOL47_001249 [Perkinsus chesapeaki]